MFACGIGGGGTNGVDTEEDCCRGGDKRAVLIVICGAFGPNLEGTETLRAVN